MKKIFRALTLCLVLLSLLCAAVPAAFAAGNKEDAFYTIGLDACGGVSSIINNINVIYKSIVELNNLLGGFIKK